MTDHHLAKNYDGGKLLGLLLLLGWTVRREPGAPTTLAANRDGKHVTASGDSLAAAIGSLFIRAMRVGQSDCDGDSGVGRRNL